MANKPTLDELEQDVLSIYSQFNVRDGEALPSRNLYLKWDQTNNRNEELIKALESLIAKKFLEEKKGKDCFFLTKIGFDAMP